MARNKTEIIESSEAPILNEQKFQELADSANALVDLNAEREKNVQGVAVRIGYEGPTDVHTLRLSLADAARRANMALMEFGSFLVLLKAQYKHGEWLELLDEYNLHPRAAQRYMVVSLRFADSRMQSQVKALGFSKMLEMVALDDEQIEELLKDGTLNGFEVGDIDKASYRELKLKLGLANEKIEDLERIQTGKEKKINSLDLAASKFRLDKEWPAQISATITTINQYAAESERFLGVLMQACTQAMEAAPNDEAGQQVWAQGAAALAARVRDVMARQKEVIAAADSHFLMTLNQYLED